MHLLNKSVVLLLCWSTVLSKAASFPSFTSSVEEGRTVCPGEELTYNCTIFDDTNNFPPTTWSGFCAAIIIAHGIPAQESGICGPFVVNATGSDGDCYTSTLTVTVTASPDLNGRVIRCSHESVEVGRATLLVAGPPSPIPIPTRNPSTDTLTSTTIEWSVPGDSGANITSYNITYTSESGEGVESVDGSATSALLTGLTPNVDYEASITASNCAGTSEPTAFSFRIQGTVPPALEIVSNQYIFDCTGASINLSWKIPHPPPPPAYEPVEAVWVNYTVEKEDGATSEMSSGPLPPSTESFVIENLTSGAYNITISVSAVNQLGSNESTISVTVDSFCCPTSSECSTTSPPTTSAGSGIPTAEPTSISPTTSPPSTGTTTTPTGPTPTPTSNGGSTDSNTWVAVVVPVVVIILVLLVVGIVVVILVLVFRGRGGDDPKEKIDQSSHQESPAMELDEFSAPGYSQIQFPHNANTATNKNGTAQATTSTTVPDPVDPTYSLVQAHPTRAAEHTPGYSALQHPGPKASKASRAARANAGASANASGAHNDGNQHSSNSKPAPKKPTPYKPDIQSEPDAPPIPVPMEGYDQPMGTSPPPPIPSHRGGGGGGGGRDHPPPTSLPPPVPGHSNGSHNAPRSTQEPVDKNLIYAVLSHTTSAPEEKKPAPVDDDRVLYAGIQPQPQKKKPRKPPQAPPPQQQQQQPATPPPPPRSLPHQPPPPPPPTASPPPHLPPPPVPQRESRAKPPAPPPQEQKRQNRDDRGLLYVEVGANQGDLRYIAPPPVETEPVVYSTVKQE